MKNIVIFLTVILFVACDSKNVDMNFYDVPAWSQKAIWYQIFTERFWNGDLNNDPELDDMAGGWPHFRPKEWQIHPWTSDWYKMQSWEKINGKDFYWNHGLRRYGGDIQGVLDRLDYLQELGITAIYFNPLFESPSLHKYDASLYHHIDNNFGPDPQRDKKIWALENPADPNTWQWTAADKLFLKLLKECHNRKMHVIIDGVFNHVGYMFWAFQDVVEKQQSSEYSDWFIIKKWDNPETKVNEFEYLGWNGVLDLPEFREDENGLVQGPANHVYNIIKRWMDPNGDGDPSDGIDGWRLDVAEMVNITFWKNFRKWVKELNPEAYITGEVWWQDWPRNKMFNAAPWLQGDVFDAVMNYRFGRALKLYFLNETDKISTQAFIDSINTLRNDYRKENFYALMNLVGSHDMERIASQVVNPDLWVDHGGNPAQNPNFKVRKPNEVELKKQMLIVGVQMTLPGAPMVYYGDEAGMWGGDDPDCRKPMVWPELNYEDETTHPLGKDRSKDKVSFNHSLFEWYKKCIRIRKNESALSLGDLEFITQNNPNILVYKRSFENSDLWIIVNNSHIKEYVDLNFVNNSNLLNLINNEEINCPESGVNISINSYDILILK